jgi:hypothetical protein
VVDLLQPFIVKAAFELKVDQVNPALFEWLRAFIYYCFPDPFSPVQAIFFLSAVAIIFIGTWLASGLAWDFRRGATIFSPTNKTSPSHTPAKRSLSTPFAVDRNFAAVRNCDPPVELVSVERESI